MVRVIAGDRVGRQGQLAIGCSAALFNDSGRILLTRRADNQRWDVPGGYMEPGETMSEACCREVLEETGLVVCTVRLISVYTNAHLLLEYPDGNRWQMVILHFEVERLSGEPTVSAETTAWNYFSQDETATVSMSPLDRLRVADAFAKQPATIVRDTF